MSKVKFVLNRENVRKEILQNSEVLRLCEKEAKKECKANQHVKAFIGFSRAMARVYHDTEKYHD